MALPSNEANAQDALAKLVDNAVADNLIDAHVSLLASPSKDSESTSAPHSTPEVVAVGLAALDAFLQVNVTGPVLPRNLSASLEDRFVKAWNKTRQDDQDRATALHQLRRACLKYLEVDGISPYAHIPRLELFSLARYIFKEAISSESVELVQLASPEGSSTKCSLAWTRLRINVWHYKLITQPSLGSGSNFNKSAQWSDIPTLATRILNDMDTLRTKLFAHEVWAVEIEETWTNDEKALFLIEAASNYILLGRYDKAKETLAEATKTTGLVYALSGALGKRTKFQENDVSQLVVFARGADDKAPTQPTTGGDGEAEDDENAKPDALMLNNDTLLEEIHFAKEKPQTGNQVAGILPPQLADLSPDDQPQLSALDEMILLTEATIKDAFSPVDTLTSEQILPFAVRVLNDKSVNWQVYTQALLVRSRIEIHRSRTVERGVLQLQAVADQVLTDTTYAAPAAEESALENADSIDVPAIQVIAPGQAAPVDESKPAAFLPAPKQTESAPAHVRLRYIHALSTPPRWHLESELAYAWAGIGSMASALEIFKRLKLWAEVALCFASAAAAEDEDGRGSGGEDKAKGIIRWRLFSKTGSTSSSSEPEDDVVGQDVTHLRAADFSGPERDPPPPDAARLWCILGDLENNPAHYEHSWEISKHRYSRAQRSLGEFFLQQKDWTKALDAYKKATLVNRLSPDMWSRLGDICLRLGQFEDAAEAYSRSISSANDVEGGEGARTWSNLGSALYSLYTEITAGEKTTSPTEAEPTEPVVNDDENLLFEDEEKFTSRSNPSKLLIQSLSAYKRGASIAHDNWRIWDNVVTLASRIHPIPVGDIVLALTHIIRIRKTEEALDADLLSALLQDTILTKPRATAGGASASAVHEFPRGSPGRLVSRLIEEQIVPIITKRSELWALVSRLRAWRHDFAGAIDASERAWRAAAGSSGSGGSGGLLPGESASGSADWTTDEKAWAEVVKRTDELVSVLENWGADVEAIGPKWKGKARNAVRSVMGRGRTTWEDSEGWKVLERLMGELKVDRS